MDKNGYADMTADDYDDRPDAKWLQHICNYSHVRPKYVTNFLQAKISRKGDESVPALLK
jgi:hypothetical protein